MAVTFKLGPRRGQKRQASADTQGELVETIGPSPSASAGPAPEGPRAQWFERPHRSLEHQLEALPDPPTEEDYEAMPIGVFSQTVMARLVAGSPIDAKRPRN